MRLTFAAGSLERCTGREVSYGRREEYFHLFLSFFDPAHYGLFDLCNSFSFSFCGPVANGAIPTGAAPNPMRRLVEP